MVVRFSARFSWVTVIEVQRLGFEITAQLYYVLCNIWQCYHFVLFCCGCIEQLDCLAISSILFHFRLLCSVLLQVSIYWVPHFLARWVDAVLHTVSRGKGYASKISQELNIITQYDCIYAHVVSMNHEISLFKRVRLFQLYMPIGCACVNCHV